MKLQWNLILGLFALLFSSAYAQEGYKKEIKREFTEYLDALTSKEFEKSLDYIHPKLFELLPKEQLLTIMETVFDSKEFSFEFKDSKILQINDGKYIDENYYALLTYSSTMLMYIKETENMAEMSEEEKAFMYSFMEMSLEREFGEGQVAFFKDGTYFEIKASKEVYAISNNGQTDWKFIVLEKNQLPMLKLILPEELIIEQESSSGEY